MQEPHKGDRKHWRRPFIRVRNQRQQSARSHNIRKDRLCNTFNLRRDTWQWASMRTVRRIMRFLRRNPSLTCRSNLWWIYLSFRLQKSLKHLPRHVHYGHVGSGAGRCPGDPSHRSASLWVGEPTSALFAGTHSDSSLADRLLIRWDLRPGTSGYKRTARYNTKWLDGEFLIRALSPFIVF